MRALVYEAWETLRMHDVPEPTPGPGEVRLRVEAAGICGSELEAVRKHSPRRTPPLILGHEFTGTIDQVGQGVDGWHEGDPVVANAVIADGTCAPCRRGLTNVCVNRRLFGMNLPGAFAQYVNVPSQALIPRPNHVPPDHAALSEPLANGVHVAGLLKPYAPETVVVFGAGPIGLMALQAIRIVFGARVAAVDRIPSRLEIAKRLGAEIVAQPDDMKSIKEWAGEQGIDASVDAVGAGATKAASIAVVRPGGTAVWIGLHEDESPVSAYGLILPEKRVLGSYACTQAELAEALDWIASGRVDVDSWISRFPLEDSENAFQRMLDPGPDDVKAVLQMIC